MVIPGVLFYAVIIYSLLFGLEFYLAKQPKRWLGLLPPVSTYCLSLYTLASNWGTGYGSIISNFVRSNIITVLLLVLYFFQRHRMK